MNMPSTPDLSAIRARLQASRGKQFWRSLEEVAETDEFRAFLEDEFPSRADEWHNAASRRDMLRLMGAMFALAGLTGCTRQPDEKILPYVRQPEEIIPGKPLFFATAMPFRFSAMGLLVESNEGRPTKIEGNPDHPESLGRTFAWQQAAPLDLYDPERSQAVTLRGRISSWGRFLGAMADLRQNAANGQGMYFLTPPITSPTLEWQRRDLMTLFPALQWHEYDPVSLTATHPVAGSYQFEKADVILALDSDFLLTLPGSIPCARAFISRRRADADRARMNRLYVAEPTPTLTGDIADHRLPVKAGDIERIAAAVGAQLGAAGAAAPAGLSQNISQWAAAVARDLQAHRGAALVIAGEHQPRRVHDLVRAMNDALGSTGTTVTYAAPPQPAGVRSLKELNDAMKAGQVKTLFIASANPVYDAPADLGFADNIHKVPLRVHLGLYQNETAALCHWHVPEAHFLESWSDARAYDGTRSIIQPLIAPLYDGRTTHELLASLTDRPDRSPYQIVREFWMTQRPAAEFEDFWERTVHDGFTSAPPAAAAAQPTPATAKPPSAPAQVSQAPVSPQSPVQSGGLEIVFRPDPSVWDGRFANNGWLQELAKPVSKITWGNAAYISPATAERLNLRHAEMVELEYRGRKVRAPLWVTPGQAADSITVFLGYGRTRSGRASQDLGYNAYALRTWDHPHFDNGLEIRGVGDKHNFNSTQTHHSLEGRDIVRASTNAEFLKNHRILENEEKEKNQYELSMYPSWQYEGYKWGMAIDMNACIGCSACITACQSENNIPVVGGDQVRRGREMQWLRVDRYHQGNLDNPTVYFQPIPCMHCEQAPCEPVCPVAATVHSAEGLNQMIYNRCVGTRYCSNNCPYKVRRFNFYLYPDWDSPSLAAVRNPDVTIRSRGVMEKCTYCVQRIQEAKIEAEKADRRVRDGEIVTACQGVCPTDAIVFGDINDKNSRVSKLKQSPLNYSLLAELGTQPRTTHLGKLRNPNPELERES